MQAGLREFLRELRQKQSVGGHGHILQLRKAPKPPQEFHRTPPEQRLAAGEAKFPHPAAHKRPDDSVEFG